MTAIALLSCAKEQVSEIVQTDSENGMAFTITSVKSNTYNTKGITNASSQVFAQDGVVITLIEADNAESIGNYVETKGTPIESLSTFLDKTDEFTIWGWNNGVPIAELSNPHSVKKNGSVYTPVDGSGQFEKIDLSELSWITPRFYALAQPEEAGTLNITSATNDNLVFNYTMPTPDPTTDCDAQAQKEILTGIFSGTSSSLSENKVPITFTQPFAAVRFKVGSVNSNFKIKSITLDGIISKATCSVNTETGAISWSDHDTKSKKTYVQIFNQDVTGLTPSGTDINDDELTKTFFVIPYTFPSAMDESIIISYIKGGVEKTASLPLREITWEAGKSYTYTIDCMTYPWIDFGNTDKRGGGTIEDIDFIIDEYVHFSYPQVRGDYEKFIIPIHDLEEGTWYNLDFSELITPSGDYWNGRGEYACTVSEHMPTSINRASMITFYGGSDNETYNKYYWMGYINEFGASANYPSLWKEHNILTFKATAETMYWIWDSSKCDDDFPMNLTFTNNGISIITEPVGTVAAVDFLNADHYGYWHNDVGSTSINAYYTGYSTFKTYASYGTAEQKGGMEFHMYPKKGTYEKINIPLINLTAGQKYRIDFKYKFEEVVCLSSYSFGFYIGDAKNTLTTKASDSGYTDFQDLSGNVTLNQVYDVSYEFTATSENMYMVWCVTRLSDQNKHTMIFSDTTITEVNP